MFDNQSEQNTISELLESFHLQNESDEKKEKFTKLLNETQPIKFLQDLFEKQEDEVILYIISNFVFEDKDIYSFTFISAIKHGCIDIVNYYLKFNLIEIVECKDENDSNPIILSVIYGQLMIAKSLINSYPEFLNLSNNNVDPLTIAIFNNDLLMFHLIFTNLSSKVRNINELMIIAIKNENIHIVQQLIASQTDFFIWDNILIHYAVSQTSIDMFNIINKLNFKSDYGVDDATTNKNYLNYQNETGDIPLHWCVLNGHINVMKCLIDNMNKHGQSLDVKNNNGITPFILSCLKQDKEACQLLFSNGVNVNEYDNEGNSICHLLAATGDKEWLEYIVKKYNLNIFLKNNYGNSPLIPAILSEKVETVDYFLSLVPNLNWRNKLGQTCLHASVFSQNIKIIKRVLLSNPDIEIEDITGLTAYHYAIMENNKEIIKILDEYMII